MQPDKAWLLAVFLLTGSVLVALSIPLIRGRVPPNSAYGFRVKRTLENPGIWYPANRYAAYHILAVGVAIAIAATALYLLPQVGFQAYAWSCLAVTLAGLTVGLARSFAYLKRL